MTRGLAPWCLALPQHAGPQHRLRCVVGYTWVLHVPRALHVQAVMLYNNSILLSRRRSDMTNQAIYLTRSDSKLLMRAALGISLSELKALVNDSIQYGPAPSLLGSLHRIEKQTTPPICWESLLEFVSWGAGIVAQDDNYSDAYLLLDSAHIDRVLRSIRKHLDRLDEQGTKEATGHYLQRLVAQADAPQKHDKAHEPR